MTKHDASELAYKNGYEAGRADMMNTVNALEGKIRHLEAERDAAVADLETIAKKLGNPCDWCANYYDVNFSLTRCMTCDDEEHNGNFEWCGLLLAEKTSDKEEKHE